MTERVCGDHALLQSLAEGTLTADEERLVKEHVAACAACRAAVKEYKAIMWDLERPREVEIPPELERSYEALMQAWRKEHQRRTAPARAPRLLVPSWAAYSMSWTRSLPAAGMVRTLLRRAGSAIAERSLPRWLRRKSGGRR